MNDRGVTWRRRMGFTLMLGLAGVSAGAVAAQILEPRAVYRLGLVVDRLTASLGLLVATVGAVVYRFATRYLDGEAGQDRFLARLAGTVASAYVLVLSDDLFVLFAAWMLTSLGLHGLLTHYPDRAEALRPARKKFLISRLGDLALVSAIVLIGVTWHTLEISSFDQAIRASGDEHRLAAGTVAVLIALAALTKSAQFPFHSWLPETMEAPTPVSALMHAGIINAGGALLLKFAPVIVRTPEALVLLSVVGTLTATIGLPAMWSQVKVKRTLAWSTVAQMGFMMTQCGLAAFPAAWLHILGHGLYKAWNFLRSGEIPAGMGSFRQKPVSPLRSLGLVALGTILAIPTLVLASAVTGFDPAASPGELALSAMVALSIGQLWLAILGKTASFGKVGVALGGTLAVSVSAFSLYQLAGAFLAPVLGELHSPQGVAAWVAAAVPVAAMLGLTVLQLMLPVLASRPAGRAFYVHALNGFYFGAVADRWVDRVWVRFADFGFRKGVQGA